MRIADIHRKIKSGLSGELPLTELSAWATSWIHACLRDGMVDLAQIKCYPLLCALQDIEECGVEELQRLDAVLCGRLAKGYTFSFCLSAGHADHAYAALRDEIGLYLQNDAWSQEAFSIIDRMCCAPATPAQTITELLTHHLHDLLANNIILDDESKSIRFERGNFVFQRKNTHDARLFWTRIMRLLDCCLGESDFEVCVDYAESDAYLSLVL